MRCGVLVFLVATIFVTTLQDDYKDSGNIAMRWFFWVATIFCNNFMLPKRRFWMAERTFGNAFRSTFQRGEYSIWATLL
jgi:hypothetical protein